MTTKTKKIAAVVAVALLGATAAGAAVAKRAHDNHHAHREFRGEHRGIGFLGNFSGMKTRLIARALDLDSEQREKTRALINDVREFQRQSRDSSRDAVMRAFAADSLSAEQAAELLAMRENRRDEMRAFVGAKLAEFHAMLTPAQRERAAELWAERRHGFRFHNDRHHYDDHRDGRHG